jgi:flagellar basal-body rod protein FlgC
MGMFSMMQVSASALAAERQRAEVTAVNLANAETTHTDQGGPYVRKEVVFSATHGSLFHAAFNECREHGASARGFGAADGRG